MRQDSATMGGCGRSREGLNGDPADTGRDRRIYFVLTDDSTPACAFRAMAGWSATSLEPEIRAQLGEFGCGLTSVLSVENPGHGDGVHACSTRHGLWQQEQTAGGTERALPRRRALPRQR